MLITHIQETAVNRTVRKIKRAVGIGLILVLILLAGFVFQDLHAQSPRPAMSFVIGMPQPSNHLYAVTLTAGGVKDDTLDFKMCAWTPGFYEIVDFAGAVQDFQATAQNGDRLSWSKKDSNTWRVLNPHKTAIRLSYNVKAESPFIGNINLQENYGYIIPAGLCLYLQQELRRPVGIEIKPAANWDQYVASPLDALPNQPNVFTAADFDVLYDSPFLMGKPDSLPSFLLKGKRVQFVGHDLGDFDKIAFMQDLKKITAAASGVIGDVPFNHYTFIAVGMHYGGFGGIEHLASVSMMINTNGIFSPERKSIFYAFLAHEYFHLYNVKRIRPIALGPFDYTKENYTNMLWVSEGFTDYYQYLILRRAGLMTDSAVLANYQEHIRNYENGPGHLLQSVTRASRGIWAIRGNPNARTGDERDSTISVYDKGCALGLMIDLAIRHSSSNKRSLDDVMRFLYRKYYQQLKRGFTDAEFQQACEQQAGVSLAELFGYASTVQPVNYPKYFAYAGLMIDTALKQTAELFFGADLGMRDSALLVKSTEYASPARLAGLLPGDEILTVDSAKADLTVFNETLSRKNGGDRLLLTVKREGKSLSFDPVLTTKKEKSFSITKLPNPTPLQMEIYKSWLRGAGS